MQLRVSVGSAFRGGPLFLPSTINFSGNSPPKHCKGAGQKMFSVDYPSRLDNLRRTL
jgi:hypothetical protein